MRFCCRPDRIVPRAGLTAALAIAAALQAGPAAAEVVYLSTGGLLLVTAVRSQGDDLVLHLRSGGELRVPRAMIAEVEPDRIEYSERARAGLPSARALPEPPAIPEQYRGLIARLAALHGVDARLVHAVVRAESAYHSQAVSSKGALGLMQLLPSTGSMYGALDLFDPEVNLDAGIRHLRSLLDRFELPVAVAAYNAGAAAVERFGGIPPFEETKTYVGRVLAALAADSADGR
jgi:soluble lytic murein transglycosylase-like protein